MKMRRCFCCYLCFQVVKPAGGCVCERDVVRGLSLAAQTPKVFIVTVITVQFISENTSEVNLH